VRSDRHAGAPRKVINPAIKASLPVGPLVAGCVLDADLVESLRTLLLASLLAADMTKDFRSPSVDGWAVCAAGGLRFRRCSKRSGVV